MASSANAANAANAAIAAELADLDAEHAQIQRRLDHLTGLLDLSTLTRAATGENPFPHYAEYHMPAANALMHLSRSDQLPMQMQMPASAPMQMPASAIHARLVQPTEPRQRTLDAIKLNELQEICRENGISTTGTKKELSDRICHEFGTRGVTLIETKLAERPSTGGKSHRRKSRHRHRKTNRAH
jgi:hypothetical protein